MALDLTAFEPVLKELYDGQAVKELVYPKNPFYGMLKKVENFEGDVYPLPLRSENNQAISSTFAVGKAHNGSSVYKRFSLNRVKKYGFADIDGETARASKSNKGAFIEALKTEIDSTKLGVTNSISADLFGNGVGDLATVMSIAGAVITLSGTAALTKLHVGMRVVIYDSTNATQRAGGSTLGGIDNTFAITARNVDNGTVTLNATPTSVVADDLIFRAGDRGNVASGLGAWLPAPSSPGTRTVPAADFFGVNRSEDPTRLAGLYFDKSSNSGATKIQDALIESLAVVQREGGDPDVSWISFEKYSDLVKEIGAKVEYDRRNSGDASMAEFSFKGIKLLSAYGEIMIMADKHCPAAKAYLLQMDTWALYSLEQAVMLDTLDGNKLLRSNDSDGVEARILGYFQLGCNAPGWNAVIDLP